MKTKIKKHPWVKNLVNCLAGKHDIKFVRMKVKLSTGKEAIELWRCCNNCNYKTQH